MGGREGEGDVGGMGKVLGRNREIETWVHTWAWLTKSLSAGLVPHQLLSCSQQLLFALHGLA